jgi:hypothetical protein
MPPKPLIDPQELARRNRESAAVHREFRRLCRLRRLRPTPDPLPEKVGAALDHAAAERTARPTRAVGFFLP